jgi:hypothetical protein
MATPRLNPRCTEGHGKLGSRLFLVLCLILASVSISGQETTKPSNTADKLSSDEYAVYAVALNGLFKEYENRKIYIQSRTLSFECGEKSCNTFKGRGGCSEMRGPEQSAQEVLAYLKDSFADLQQSTTKDFEKKNNHCFPLENLFPLDREYLWSDEHGPPMLGKKQIKETPEEWKDSDFVYVSRVGLNADRTQALLYWVVVCHQDCGWFGYYFCEKKNGTWSVVDNYKVGER